MIMGGPGRSPRLVVAGLFAGAVAALLLVIAGAHVRPSGHARTVVGTHHIGSGRVRNLPTPSAAPSRPSLRPSAASDVAGIVAATAGLLLLVVGLVILVRLILAMLRWRVRKRGPTRAAEPAELAPEDLVEHIGAAVDEALDELSGDRPVSDAIILCWQRLEGAAEDAGIVPVASDTPEEAIDRVFAAARVRLEPLRSLAALYREARFSRHALGQAQIEAARAALTAILDDLRLDSRAVT
jgi:hypothetical protein